MKKRIINIISVIVVFLGVVFAFIYNHNKNKVFDEKIVSTVILDINPSIEINLNKNEEVVSIVALNDDAKEIVSDELAGKTLEETFKVITENIFYKGYASSGEVTILVTTSGDINKDHVGKLISDNFEETVVYLTLILEEASDSAKENALKYDISEGKASYIESILEENENLTFEDLKDKSINELQDIKNNEVIEESIVEEKKEEVKEEVKQEVKKDNSNNNSNANNNNNNKSNESTYSGVRSGSLRICDNATYNLSDKEAKEAAINLVGADEAAKWGAQTTAHNYNGICAWETIFYYNGMKYYIYHNVTTGEFLYQTQEEFVAYDFQAITKIIKNYFVENFGVSSDDVFIQSSGSSGYDDPNNEIIAKVGETYYTVIMKKKTGEVLSCTEGKKY